VHVGLGGFAVGAGRGDECVLGGGGFSEAEVGAGGEFRVGEVDDAFARDAGDYQWWEGRGRLLCPSGHGV